MKGIYNMRYTIKELINQLLDFPMDALIEIQCIHNTRGRNLVIFTEENHWGDKYIVISSNDE